MTEASENAPPPPPTPAENTAPTADAVSDDARNWALFSHLGLAATFLLFGNIIAPLAIWLVKGREHPHVDRHAKEALNFQISCTIYAAVSLLLVPLLGLGALMLLALFVLEIIFIIKATLAAYRGQSYQYPLSIRLIP